MKMVMVYKPFKGKHGKHKGTYENGRMSIEFGQKHSPSITAA